LWSKVEMLSCPAPEPDHSTDWQIDKQTSTLMGAPASTTPAYRSASLTHTEITVTASMRLFVLGAVLLLAGLGAGFFPLKSAWFNCGSAFGGASGSDGTDIPIEGARISGRLLGPDTCGDDRGNMRMAAIGLLVAAGVSAAGGGVVASAGNERGRK
jgi:hypothetical protein